MPQTWQILPRGGGIDQGPLCPFFYWSLFLPVKMIKSIFVPKKGKRKSLLSLPWDFYCWFYLLFKCIWRHPHSLLFRQLRKGWFLQPYAPAHVFCCGSCYQMTSALRSKPFLWVRQQPQNHQPHSMGWVWILDLSSAHSSCVNPSSSPPVQRMME